MIKAVYKAMGLMMFYGILNATMVVNATDSPTTAELRVLVKGLGSNKGQVRFKLFRTEDSYNRQARAFREGFVAISDRMSEWVVNGIPPQEYSVVIYHDENGNEEFDKNLLGIPKEAYGFSNNIRPKLAQPSYEEVKFKLAPPVTSIEIKAQR